MDVIAQRVTFRSQGKEIIGKLYLPLGFSESKKYRSVVVTGSWFTAKEQMPDVYAKQLSQQGFIVLTFDFRYFGESEGEPRYYEMPADKIDDIVSAVQYLKTLPYVSPKKITGLGICLSAGMMAAASTKTADIQAIALVAPGLQNRDILVRAFGSEANLQVKINEGKVARKKYETTGKVDYIPVVSARDERAAVVVPDESDYYLDPNRGATPTWTNQFAVMSWAPFIEFDSVAVGKDVEVPTLMIHSETAANPEAAHVFFANLTGHKEEYWMPGTQYDFYDQEPQVTKAANAVATFFKTES